LVRARVINLRKIDPRKWAIGLPPDVSVKSARHSERIQVNYYLNRDKRRSLRETYHAHTYPIEEYYCVLTGSITVVVDGENKVVKAREILPVPPEVPHMVVAMASNAEFLVLRTPPSTEKTRILVPPENPSGGGRCPSRSK
jgi:mannose-6-phosphate isomerase-like protein (cupin superfamily)